MAGCDGARVVITGLGVVSPIGIGKQAFWNSLTCWQGKDSVFGQLETLYFKMVYKSKFQGPA